MNKNFWQESITIGNLTIPRFMAAPLDGLTNSPFRQLIRRFSPTELLMTEMRHVAHVRHAKHDEPLRFSPCEQPLAFQFSGNTTDFVHEAVEKVIQSGFVMINLNCGCPAKVVVKSKSGSALMADLPKLEAIIRQFMISINGRIPFTIKIRAGFKNKNALEVAKLAQDCGVQAIIIHPRTQPEGFAARLDFDLVNQLKKSVNMPVIFSGNINSFLAAQKTYDLTGVDGFMIGRALWGAPWKIREITDEAQGKKFSISQQEVLSLIIDHLALNMQFFGPRGFVLLKKHIPLYIRETSNAAAWRKAILQSQTECEMRAILTTIVEESSRASVP